MFGSRVPKEFSHERAQRGKRPEFKTRNPGNGRFKKEKEEKGLYLLRNAMVFCCLEVLGLVEMKSTKGEFEVCVYPKFYNARVSPPEFPMFF